MQSIFDAQGLPRRDLDEKSIAKLSKPQQKALFAVQSTYLASDEAEVEFIATEKATRSAAQDLKKRMAEYEAVVPRRTFYDEWKVTVAKQPERTISSEKQAQIEAALQAVDHANVALEQRRAAEFPAKQRRKEARQAFANALRDWSLVDGRPKSVSDLVKENAKRESDRKLALIAAGLPPDHDAVQSSVGDSHLDRVKASGGRGHSANFGYNRNSMRGATVKPPSQR
ncbi:MULTISPECIES: hypothetical protein [Bradyrhizobium]|uniref:Uncharacterized protein n=2 Tax=Bradyrhizobium TaxID=374 RepID=A0ABY0PK20_9BRAD|nr:MULTISPECIES: hypothetical protein [Bradyrhizobium]SDI55249.1 hypothetical protein SAMN05444163_3105 [Bradyrhizobium ottawaense]SED42214.1 hypothetical protein SAMN05444171_4064 [Bradyrhizobium lablabi]